MAITAASLDTLKRTLFFRVNKQKVPVELPFDLVTIDSNDQFYEPVPVGRVVFATGLKQRGSASGAVYLDRNEALPIQRGLKQESVWMYGGV